MSATAVPHQALSPNAPMCHAWWTAIPKILPDVPLRLGSWDTNVASFCVRPNKPWNASSLLPVAARLGRGFLICGDFNGHHTAWRGDSCCARGRDAADVTLRAGLKILNTGEPTFEGRGVRTAIDISLATERGAYAWSICPDTWGTDHFTIFLDTNTAPSPRSRVCSTVNWVIFQRLSATPAEGDFLQHVVDSAKAATVVSRSKPGHRVPDLKELQLWATRRRAEHRAIRSSGRRIGQLSGGWTLSADAAQTDDGNRAGKVCAVPSPALGAVQLRGGFCGRYNAGQPSVSLYWRWPSPRACRSWLWRTSWRVSSQGDHQEYPQRPGSPTD
ncbi:hypothetical protein MTO96_038140 [Rhipicephalus appendiculatus]